MAIEQRVSQGQETGKLIKAGKVFWLTKDPEPVRVQIEGNNFDIYDFDLLLNWANTDQLIPSQYCMQYSDAENLGRYLGTGFEGISRDDIKSSNSEVLVLGKSAGRGSSREHAQMALAGAGIKIVIAKSFERIFWENCRNWKIFTLPLESDEARKVIEGEYVEMDDLLSHYDNLSKDIISYGGLLPYTKARLEGKVFVPKVDTEERPMSIAEKIIARNVRVQDDEDGVVAVKPGDAVIVRVDKKYAYELQTIVSQYALNQTFGENAPIDPQNTWLFEDHLALMPDDSPVTVRHRDAQRAFAEKYSISEYRADRDGVEGICHTVMLERHVLPGELVFGNDSHTCHLGVANALAVGKGASEFAAALITQDVPINVPETIRVVLKGRMRQDITTTDVMLYIISRDDFKKGLASGKVLQFGGEVLDTIDVDEQATFTNMSIEGQAFTGIVEPNAKLIEFMMKNHDLNGKSVKNLLVYPDEEAQYHKVVEIDLADVQRMVSLPGDTQNAVPISAIEGKKIDFYYVGSCKQGNLESLRTVARIIKDKHIAKDVVMQVQANTREVEQALKAEGLLDIFDQSGVQVIGRGCGPCMGATEDANKREEVVLSATDRNFVGRMGKNRTVYLANAEVVAASAIAGNIVAPEN